MRKHLVLFSMLLSIIFAQAPTIVSISPSQNALDAPLDSPITITLDQDMNAATINDTTMVVHGSFTGRIPGSYSTTGATATFTPGSPFKVGERISITITNDAKSATGIRVSPFSWNFTTEVLTGKGMFFSGEYIEVGDGPISIAVADLDGDDDNDLAVACHNSDSISILINNGTGHFSVAGNFGVGDRPLCVRTADLDNDGDSDLAVANQFDHNITILLNNGAGIFYESGNYSVGSYPHSITADDLDGDGDIDLAATGSPLFILLNNGSGIFSTVEYNLENDLALYPIVSDDMDLDGDNDLAVGIGISIISNDGSGAFSEINHIPGLTGFDVTSDDFDGDGDIDLAMAVPAYEVITEPALDYYPGHISVILNNGYGVFSSPVNNEVGADPNSIISADLDGDGDHDMVALNSYWNVHSLSVLLNDGSGVFSPDVKYWVGSTPKSVVSADLDGDGSLDLVVANLNSDGISLLINGYDASINYAADFNGDSLVGAEDLVIFAAAWNSRPSRGYDRPNTTIYDIGPATGTVPDLVPQPDGVIDFEDLVVFAQMWNWSLEYNGFAKSLPAIAKAVTTTPLISLIQRVPANMYEWDGQINLDLVLGSDQPILMVDGLVSNGAGNLNTSRVETGPYWDSRYEESFVLSHTSPDKTEMILAAVGLGLKRGQDDKGRTLLTMQLDSDRSHPTISFAYNLRGTDGLVMESGIIDVEIENFLPEQFLLHQNYPNPFNPTTTIRFDLPKQSQVHLIIYDMIGREVLRLAEGAKPAGYHRVRWDGKDVLGRQVASGIYFARLVTPGYSKVRKMLLLK